MYDEEDFQELFKVVLVGDSGVGKTHLITRYVSGQQPKDIAQTNGINIVDYTISLKNGQKINAQILDTAGQDRYKGITNPSFRSVYDVTQEKSFQSVVKWMDDLRYQAEPDVVMLVVGNKLDLIQNNPQARKVEKIDAQNLAQQYNALFLESSAVTGELVSECFETLFTEMVKVNDSKPWKTNYLDRGQNFTIGEDKPPTEQK
ncbi:hypothetical protein pb186bvf_000945 [Paramecium bursaria]